MNHAGIPRASLLLFQFQKTLKHMLNFKTRVSNIMGFHYLLKYFHKLINCTLTERQQQRERLFLGVTIALSWINCAFLAHPSCSLLLSAFHPPRCGGPSAVTASV